MGGNKKSTVLVLFLSGENIFIGRNPLRSVAISYLILQLSRF
jgi:hypothetical protein